MILFRCFLTLYDYKYLETNKKHRSYKDNEIFI